MEGKAGWMKKEKKKKNEKEKELQKHIELSIFIQQQPVYLPQASASLNCNILQNHC